MRKNHSTLTNDACVVKDLQWKFYQHSYLCAAWSWPQCHVCVCMLYVYSLCIFVSLSNCLRVTHFSLHRPQCPSSRCYFPSWSHAQLPAPPEIYPLRPHGAEGQDHTEDMRVRGHTHTHTHVQACRQTRKRQGSRVTRQRLGWKNAFFHMLLLSDLDHCRLVLAPHDLGIHPEKSYKWQLAWSWSQIHHVGRRTKRTGPLTTLGSAKRRFDLGLVLWME